MCRIRCRRTVTFPFTNIWTSSRGLTGLKAAKRLQTVESIEDFTNLSGIRDKMLVALSKGMKQRVTLARALLHDPAVLIMDEPAAGPGSARAN